MKIFISTAVLKKALKTGKLFASPKIPKPILRNVLLKAESGDRVTLASTDIEKTAKAFTNCAQVLEPGAALLPSEAVKTLEKIKSEYITIDVIKNRVTVEAGAFKTTFYTEDVEEFPHLETVTAPLFTTTGKDLARLARVCGFTEKENGRYALGGVLLDLIDAGKVYTIATDGRRMGVQEIAAETAENAPVNTAILSRDPFLKAVKALEKAGPVSVSIVEKGLLTVVFSAEEMEISIPCLEGCFPEWRKGINQLANPSISWMDRDALLSLETFAESVTDGANPGIVLERKDEKTLDIWGVLGLNEGSTTAPAQVAPDFPLIKLNWNFLRDFLKVAPAGELTVKTRDARSGVLFETADNFRYLVMPMHLDRKRPESTQAAQEEKPEQAPEQMEEKPLPSASPCRAFVFSSSEVSSRPGEVLATVKKALASDYKNEQPSREEKQAAEQPSRKGASLESDPVFQAMKKAMEAAKKTEPAKRVKIAPTGSSAPLATVTPAEPAERPSVRASEPAPVESAPLPSDPAPAPAPAEPMEAPQPKPSRAEQPSRADEPSRAEKPFEIGTYTTKKGKIKTSIRFFQPPTPAQIDALKKAYYWEYNGTWNGSPRKLPEIFKH